MLAASSAIWSRVAGRSRSGASSGTVASTVRAPSTSPWMAKISAHSTLNAGLLGSSSMARCNVARAASQSSRARCWARLCLSTSPLDMVSRSMSSRSNGLALRPLHLLGKLAILDDANGRNALHPQLLGEGLVLGDVRKAQRKLAFVLPGKPFERLPRIHRGRHLIGPEQPPPRAPAASAPPHPAQRCANQYRRPQGSLPCFTGVGG